MNVSLEIHLFYKKALLFQKILNSLEIVNFTAQNEHVNMNTVRVT